MLHPSLLGNGIYSAFIFETLKQQEHTELGDSLSGPSAIVMQEDQKTVSHRTMACGVVSAASSSARDR